MQSHGFYYRQTHGIRVTVRPLYMRTHSLPAAQKYVFAYFVRIENVGAQAAQLLSRRWLIHDALGGDSEVVGEGVVGEQPTIEPGSVHEYQSSCVLRGPSGYMEGQYFFVREDDSRFTADIPRFLLEADSSSGWAS